MCFDAKECAVDTYPLRNIHEHQINFMRDFEKQNGISFLIIMFTHRNEFYYMRFRELEKYLNRVNEGHPMNFKYEELDKAFFIKPKASALVHYLEGLQMDLGERED